MTIWFTSDHHFYHQNIISFCARPFRDIHHMNEMMILWYNQYVAEDDTVYFLGDVCFGSREQTVPIVDRLNGFKILVPGNHDYCHPMHDRVKEKYLSHIELYSQYFDQILFEFPMLDGFRMSHFPYKAKLDYQGRDFSEWQADDDGTPLLCGHVHDEWRTNVTSKKTFMYNVGVDANGLLPVSFDHIKQVYNAFKEQ